MTAHVLPGMLLNTQPNIEAPDDFYQELVDLHRDLSAQQSALVNAKLILLLANHVGDPAILREAMRAARQDIAPEAQGGAAICEPHAGQGRAQGTNPARPFRRGTCRPPDQTALHCRPAHHSGDAPGR